MARRIVPELISPTQASAVHPAFEAAAEQAPVLRFNLKEQAELAKSLLEPGRKLYVDISQESKVNWRKLQNAAGVQKKKPQHKAAPALPLDKSSVPQAPLPMGGGSNIFASVVERLASGLTMQRLEPDSDDSSSEAGEPQAHSGPESEGESDASGHHSDYYENDDGFIDDTEVHEFFGGDWHKPKHSGFYINQVLLRFSSESYGLRGQRRAFWGDIEKTDEMLLSDDPEPKKKKKLKPKQGQLGSPPQGQFQVREVMGKDGRMRKVRRRVQVDAHATPLAKKAKPSKDGPGVKSPKPVRRQAAAAAPHATAAAPAQAMPWSPDPAQRLPPWETPKPSSPQTAAPSSSAAAAPQPGPTPEEDRISLAALAAGATPAKAPKAVTESLPTSPAVGLGPPPAPSAPARTPLTGKKRAREGTEGGTGYEMPPDVKQLLDQLKAQAEALGLPRDVKDPSDEPPQAGEEKAPKKLPPQLNPLLAKLARAAARENDQHSGARTVIANAAYSFLHPWSHKGNMAVRLKKLHESAQARYDKAREGLIEAVAKQPKPIAGVLQAEAKLIGSDDEFATLPNATASQLTAPAASASGPAAAAAAGSSGLVWDKPQASALHSFVVSLLDLQGGRDDNQTMWEDVAAKSDLWGAYRPTAAELRHVYDQNKSLYSQADGEVQPRKRPRRARPPAGSVDKDPSGRASGTLDGTNTLHQPGSQDLLPLPTHTSSESPSLSPQPPQPHPSSTLAAAAGAPLSAAPTSASQPLLQQKPTEEQLAAGQNPMQEQRPQLRPQLGGGALIAAAEMQGSEAVNSGRQLPSLAQPVGALLPNALTVARAHAPAAGALVAQPSDGLSHALQPSQGSIGAVEKPPGALTSHPSGEGEGALAPGAPTKEEFLQYGVENGGDRSILEQGFTTCRRGSVKDITYKILLRAGPQGLRVAQILDAACNMGVVKENWAENRASRASQISNAMRNTKLFVHVGDHRYAIARFPGVQLIPLKPAPGKNSGEKAAIAEGTDRKTAGAPSTTSRQESDAGSLARAGSMLESHNSHVGSMAAAPSNTSMAPILPLPAQLSLFTGPPVVTAALNQAIGQNQPQQPSLPGQGQMQSLQSLLQADEPVHQTGPHSYQHSSPTVHQG